MPEEQFQKPEKQLKQLVAGVLDLMKVFERGATDEKILMANTLITFLDSFNEVEEKQDIVDITKEWCEEEVKQHAGRDDLHYYENFFHSIQTLASDSVDPSLTYQVTASINSTKQKLEEEIKKLERESYTLR